MMRVVVVWLMSSRLGQFLCMGMLSSKAARRYIDALDYTANQSGQFFASAPGKLVGKVERQTQAHIIDEASQEGSAVVKLSGHDLPTLSAAM